MSRITAESPDGKEHTKRHPHGLGLNHAYRPKAPYASVNCISKGGGIIIPETAKALESVSGALRKGFGRAQPEPFFCCRGQIYHKRRRMSREIFGAGAPLGRKQKTAKRRFARMNLLFLKKKKQKNFNRAEVGGRYRQFSNDQEERRNERPFFVPPPRRAAPASGGTE